MLNGECEKHCGKTNLALLLLYRVERRRRRATHSRRHLKLDVQAIRANVATTRKHRQEATTGALLSELFRGLVNVNLDVALFFRQ